MPVAARPVAGPAPRTSRLASFWRNAIGKKSLMAVTGIVMAVWVLLHMLGNLQAFEGAAAIDRYARLLRFEPPLLWLLRLVVFVALVVHVIAGVQLYVQKRRARPVGYAEYHAIVATPASRTMLWTGVVILGYVVYHLLDLSFGLANPDFRPGEVFHNMVASLVRGWATALYVAAVVALGLHLSHGLWSMFQSLGTSSRAAMPGEKRFGIVSALVIAIGFAAIPLAIVFGLLRS